MEDRSWVKVNEVQRVLTGLTSCSVRDHVSSFCMRLWPATLTPTVTYYPERNLPADDALASMLPRPGRFLGISITGQALMRRALRDNPERVIAKLAPYRGFTIVPIISTVSLTDPEEDDIGGFNVFRDLYLKDYDIACPEFLDRNWWRANLTPLRLKGIIGALDMLFTQRKHNLIHAIGTQTPVVGVFPSVDDSIARIFFSLRDVMPLEASQLSLTATI